MDVLLSKDTHASGHISHMLEPCAERIGEIFIHNDGKGDFVIRSDRQGTGDA